MKILHQDGNRLVLEIVSGSLLWQWIWLIVWSALWLGVGGGIIAQTRSIDCEKIEPKVVNCQITDSLFWGAIQRVQMVNGVRRAFVDEDIGYSDASQYPIYRVFITVNDAKQVPFTGWERSLDYTNEVKNSLERFLQSEAINYNFNLNSFGNISGLIVVLGLTSITLLFLSVFPYQVLLILNETANQALLIRHFFLGWTLKSSLVLDQLSLQLKSDTDSDDDTYYAVFLATPGIGDQGYSLKSSSDRQEVENYWQTNPDIKTLKAFVRIEDLLPPN